jgi:hypothetical protein
LWYLRVFSRHLKLGLFGDDLGHLLLSKFLHLDRWFRLSNSAERSGSSVSFPEWVWMAFAISRPWGCPWCFPSLANSKPSSGAGGLLGFGASADVGIAGAGAYGFLRIASWGRLGILHTRVGCWWGWLLRSVSLSFVLPTPARKVKALVNTIKVKATTAASSPSETLDPGMPLVLLPNLVLDTVSFFLSSSPSSF